jgi:hypothetical protein
VLSNEEIMAAVVLMQNLPDPEEPLVEGESPDPLANHMLRTHALLALIAVRLEAACSKLDLLTKNDPANWSGVKNGGE